MVNLVCCKLIASRSGIAEQSKVGQTSARFVWLKLTCFKFCSCGISLNRFVVDWVPRSDSDRSMEDSLLNLGQSRNCRELVGHILSLQMAMLAQTSGSLPTEYRYLEIKYQKKINLTKLYLQVRRTLHSSD